MTLTFYHQIVSVLHTLCANTVYFDANKLIKSSLIALKFIVVFGFRQGTK
jgi:hypothetical protein